MNLREVRIKHLNSEKLKKIHKLTTVDMEYINTCTTDMYAPVFYPRPLIHFP
jgi:hypothetical protein